MRHKNKILYSLGILTLSLSIPSTIALLSLEKKSNINNNNQTVGQLEQNNNQNIRKATQNSSLPTEWIDRTLVHESLFNEYYPSEYTDASLYYYIWDNKDAFLRNLPQCNPGDLQILSRNDYQTEGVIRVDLGLRKYYDNNGQLVDGFNYNRFHRVYTFAGFKSKPINQLTTIIRPMVFVDAENVLPSDVDLNDHNNALTSNIINDVIHSISYPAYDKQIIPLDIEFADSVKNNSEGKICTSVILKNSKYWENGVVEYGQHIFQNVEIIGFKKSTTTQWANNSTINDPNSFGSIYAKDFNEERITRYVLTHRNVFYTNSPEGSQVITRRTYFDSKKGTITFTLMLTKWFDSNGQIQSDSTGETFKKDFVLTGFKSIDPNGSVDGNNQGGTDQGNGSENGSTGGGASGQGGSGQGNGNGSVDGNNQGGSGQGNDGQNGDGNNGGNGNGQIGGQGEQNNNLLTTTIANIISIDLLNVLPNTIDLNNNADQNAIVIKNKVIAAISNPAEGNTVTINDIEFVDPIQKNNLIGQITTSIKLKNNLYWENGVIDPSGQHIFTGITLIGFKTSKPTWWQTNSIISNVTFSQITANNYTDDDIYNYVINNNSSFALNLPENFSKQDLIIMNRNNDIANGSITFELGLKRWIDQNGLEQNDQSGQLFKKEFNLIDFKRTSASTTLKSNNITVNLPNTIASELITSNDQSAIDAIKLALAKNIDGPANGLEITNSDIEIIELSQPNNFTGELKVKFKLNNSKYWTDGIVEPVHVFNEFITVMGLKRLENITTSLTFKTIADGSVEFKKIFGPTDTHNFNDWLGDNSARAQKLMDYMNTHIDSFFGGLPNDPELRNQIAVTSVEINSPNGFVFPTKITFTGMNKGKLTPNMIDQHNLKISVSLPEIPSDPSKPGYPFSDFVQAMTRKINQIGSDIDEPMIWQLVVDYVNERIDRVPEILIPPSKFFTINDISGFINVSQNSIAFMGLNISRNNCRINFPDAMISINNRMSYDNDNKNLLIYLLIGGTSSIIIVFLIVILIYMLKHKSIDDKYSQW